ncbi:MAG: BlaI/MecI/CopY family transcriptional regulator [Lachnospiraceae bacterium]|nr:BlaI/MecI/CopY family transcriptional regulator [Lachnospiraceae bacterium]
MEEYSLGAVESRFAELVWANAPLSTNELIRVCEQELGWKRTTTYTVLKKFIERGIFDNQNRVVVVLISKEEFYAKQSELYIERSFGGSLPSFLAAFTSKRTLSEKEIEEIEHIINGRKE